MTLHVGSVTTWKFRFQVVSLQRFGISSAGTRLFADGINKHSQKWIRTNTTSYIYPAFRPSLSFPVPPSSLPPINQEWLFHHYWEQVFQNICMNQLKLWRNCPLRTFSRIRDASTIYQRNRLFRRLIKKKLKYMIFLQFRSGPQCFLILIVKNVSGRRRMTGTLSRGLQ